MLKVGENLPKIVKIIENYVKYRQKSNQQLQKNY